MDKDLIAVPQGEIASTDIVKQIALRLAATYQPPKKRDKQSQAEYEATVVKPEDFPIVVELAMAQGHNPLSKTFHYWKQDGKIFVDDHYAPLMNWAQTKAPFTYSTRVLSTEEKAPLEGIEKGDYVVRFTAIRRADQPARQAYFKTVLDAAIAAGKTFEEALEVADRTADNKFAVTADGVVKFNEIHYQSNNQWVLNVYATPKGWTPGVTRAETRAIRNGIKRLVGVPMPEERRRLGIELNMQEVAQLAASVPEDIVKSGVAEQYMQLEARVQANKAAYDERMAGLSPEEQKADREDRVNLMRGKPETGIGEDAPIETTAVVVPEDEDPFPPGPPADHRAINDLIAQAQALGGTVNPDDPESRVVDEFQVAKLAMDTYKTEATLAEVLKSLLPGITTIAEMSDIQLWNFYQYILRRNILMDTSLGIEERLKQIPEIVSAKEAPPKTLKDAKPFLHRIFMSLTGNNTKMRRLTNE